MPTTTGVKTAPRGTIRFLDGRVARTPHEIWLAVTEKEAEGEKVRQLNDEEHNNWQSAVTEHMRRAELSKPKDDLFRKPKSLAQIREEQREAK